MSERYTELYRLPFRYCLEGCPLYVEAGTLLKDKETGKVLVQLKICNLSKYRVTSCKVTINSYEPNGNLLETVRHQFMDVDGATGSFFGTREPIYLSENTARKYDVCITEIVFDNDDVWTGTEIKWNEIDDQEKISDYFSDKELVEQFYRETGKQSVYVPRVIGGIYQCACGTLNINPEYKCRSCKQEYAVYDRFLNKEYLKERLDERKEQEFRIAEEKRIREEEEKARKEEEARQREIEEKIRAEKVLEKKKKNIKKLIVVLSAVIVIALISVSVLLISKQTKYKKGQNYLSAGEYDAAEEVFRSLGNYKDSASLSKDSVYKKAEQYFKNGEYDKAISEWTKVKEYSDSSERIEDCKAEKKKESINQQKEEQYQNALTLMNSSKYDEASLIFDQLVAYKDSTKMKQECEYKMIESLVEEDNYYAACKKIESLNTYGEHKEYYKSVLYSYGCDQFERRDYSGAAHTFGQCNDYKDAAQLQLDAQYAFVIKNKDSSSYIEQQEISYYIENLKRKNYPGAESL